MAATAGGPDPRPGRWRSGAESRQRILDSARTLFSQHGYGATTVRTIAARAGVDPAMVFYFFGNKQGLFAAALEMPDQLQSTVESLFTGGLEGMGERLVRTLVESHDKADRPVLLMLTRSASNDEPSDTLLREYIERDITGRLAALLDAPDAALRAGLVAAQLVGLAVARYIVAIEPIASASADELASRFGPVVQHCLVGGVQPAAAPVAPRTPRSRRKARKTDV